jgi:DNA-binding MarR family transcriptional regulator
MARKKIHRQLPPLQGKLDRSRFDVRTEQLSEILRRTARKHQTEKPQVFYALREVADRFDVSLSMVAAVYRQLESEGLLARLRGSRTLLKGLETGRNIAVHAIVGVPMSLSSFLTRQKCRMFFMATRRELRRRGFITAGLFYEAAEARPDFLLERIKHCKVDTVLWYRPDSCARETAHLLQDSGVRVIGVADGGLPPLACRFEISREKAVSEILTHWRKRDVIRKASVVHAVQRSAVEEERLEALLKNAGLSYEFVEAERAHCETLLDALAGDQERGIILLGAAASLFAFRAPDRLTDLMRRRRVALVDGPISLPFANAASVRVDLAAADWEGVANGIADELLTGQAFLQSGNTIFEAIAYLQAPLKEFAQTI